jgi:hypothetical protein
MTPVTAGWPTGSDYVVLEPEFFIRLYIFDNYLCFKANLNKNLNNANLPPHMAHVVTNPS